MKYIFTILAVLLGHYANAWSPTIVCDNGTFTYDERSNTQGTGREGQMVLKGNLVRWLLQDLKVVRPSRINQKGEIIIRIAPGMYGYPLSKGTIWNGGDDAGPGLPSVDLEIKQDKRIEVGYVSNQGRYSKINYFFHDCWYR